MQRFTDGVHRLLERTDTDINNNVVESFPTFYQYPPLVIAAYLEDIEYVQLLLDRDESQVVRLLIADQMARFRPRSSEKPCQLLCECGGLSRQPTLQCHRPMATSKENRRKCCERLL